MQLKCNGFWCWTMAVLLAQFPAGCRQAVDETKLGKAIGVVTVHGEPVPKTRVLFQPRSNDGPSWGTTDAKGRFEVYYALKQPGAVIGKHRVQFQQLEEESKFVIPKNYTIGSQGLEVEIHEGLNEFQFDLTKK